MQRAHRGQDAQLAQPLVRADRQIEPRRIGAIDDIQVVVAGNHQHSLGKLGMPRHRVHEIDPLARAAGIGHVAGDQDHVERLAGVEQIQFGEQPPQAFVAARPRPPAFDPEAVAFAHAVHVRQVRDAPGLARARTLRELIEILRLRHGRVGDRPDQGGDGEIGGNQHDRVGQRDHGQMAGSPDALRAAYRIRARQHRRQHRQRGGADQRAGYQSRRGAQPRALRLGGPCRQPPLGQLAQRFAAHGVGGLDGQGVERPEAVLGQPKQGAAAEPSQRDHDREDDQRPNPRNRILKLGRQLAEPDRGDDRRDPEYQPRTDDQHKPGHRQFRQADLRQQAAGERQQRATLGARCVILDVAAARIDGRLQVASPTTCNGSGLPCTARAPVRIHVAGAGIDRSSCQSESRFARIPSPVQAGNAVTSTRPFASRARSRSEAHEQSRWRGHAHRSRTHWMAPTFLTASFTM